MVTLYGILVKTMFFSEEDGAIIFTMYVREKLNAVHLRGRRAAQLCVKGKLAVNQTNLPIAVTGEFHDTDYGKVFHASEIRECGVGIMETQHYLTALNTGLSDNEAQLVSQSINGEIFQYAHIPDADKILCRKSGVDASVILQTLQVVREQQLKISLFVYIMQHKGNLSESNKLYKMFPEDTIWNLRSDPYGMVQKAKVPISIGDSIALENGIEPMCTSRIKILVEQAFVRRELDGDTCVDLDTLFSTVDRMAVNCEISKADVLEVLYTMEDVIKDEDYDVYYRRYLLRDEMDFAKHLQRLCQSSTPIPWHPEYIDQIEHDNGVCFGAQQRLAFSLLKSTGVKILTGGPGTGKTTTVNGLLRYCDMVSVAAADLRELSQMALAAPSGRASQRMAQATGREACTCHRLIEYAPYGESERYKDAFDPIDASVIVIDETSMMDISLANKVMGACKSGCLVLFVGDINQLPSVGPGTVLLDMIKSQCIPVVQLTDVYRQEGGSPIPINAKKIIEGNTDLELSGEFCLMRVEKGASAKKAAEVAAHLLSECGDSEMIQSLSPVKKGDGGTFSLNTELQPILNPNSGEELKFGYKKFHLNDRVIMQTNNYALGYFNGDIGHIKNLSKKQMDIEIGEGTTRLERSSFEDIELAYGCTVHKSQGSEYPYCIIVLPVEKKFALNRSILYTAVTRAKKGVYIIYEEDALEYAIRKGKAVQRNGRLQQRIEKLMPKIAGL